jgi:aspartate aminotransferase
LREAIAAHISRTRGIPVGPQHVSVVPGGKPIIFFPMLALLEPGDEVIYPNPGFPIYESMIRFLRRHARAHAARREPRLLLRPEPVRDLLTDAHQDGGAELAAESHRRRDSARGHQGHRRTCCASAT